MLVLSRRQGESIVLNENITITVVEIRGDYVRLRIEAPEGTVIHRKEVFEQIRRAAAGSGPSVSLE